MCQILYHESRPDALVVGVRTNQKAIALARLDVHPIEDRQIGLIAQEVEPILPEVVKTDSDGYKALAYDKIAAVLVEAMKEQQSQIEVLKARIEALENR